MSTHAEKIQQKDNQSVNTATARQQNTNTSFFQFTDNRPEAVTQCKYQDMADNSPQVAQLKSLQAMADNYSFQQPPIQRKDSPEPSRRENNTGLPDKLKTGIENLSGYSMDDVNVHYNSSKPAQLQAHAYTQGTDIHVAPGQEQNLPHEAWHVVQQKQGRVKPTLQMKGKVNINDDKGLEKEADVMGVKATQMKAEPQAQEIKKSSLQPRTGSFEAIQGKFQSESNAVIQSEQVMQFNGAITTDVMSQPHTIMGVESAGDLKTADELIKTDEGTTELERQVKTLMACAEKAKEDFKELITNVLEQVKGTVNADKGFTHVTKSTEGAIDKAKGRMTGKTTAQLTDVLRGGIICPTVEAMQEVEDKLKEKANNAYKEITSDSIGGATQWKSGLEKVPGQKTAGDLVGYGDVKYIMPIIHYGPATESQPATESENGEKKRPIEFWMYAEIQVMTIGMKDKKDKGGHSFYDVTRDAVEQADGSIIIRSTASSKKGAEELLKHQDLLEKGLNPPVLASVVDKFNALIGAEEITLTAREYSELEFAGELVYRKERLQSNLLKQLKQPKKM